MARHPKLAEVHKALYDLISGSSVEKPELRTAYNKALDDACTHFNCSKESLFAIVKLVISVNG